MKRIIQALTILAIGLCVGAMLAQQPTPPPPVIPAALVTRVFKAQAQLAQAELQQAGADAAVQSKAQVVQELFKELQTVCGDKNQPQLNQQGDPVCVAKPWSAPPPKPGK